MAEEVTVFEGSPVTLVLPDHYTAEQKAALVEYLRAHGRGEKPPPPPLPVKPGEEAGG